METYEKIRLLRELNQWSQEDMAAKLEMSAGGYAKIERGESQLNIPRLEQIAAIFNVNIWELLRSEKGGFVLQINEGDSGGDISLYAADNLAEIKMLQVQLKHCHELIKQKDKEIELLRKIISINENT